MYFWLNINRIQFLGQNNVLRKARKGKVLTLVAYLSFAERSQLIVIAPRMKESSVTIDSEPNIFSAPVRKE